MRLEQLPGSAPKLNPYEGIWNDLKPIEPGNLCCHDLAELATASSQPLSACPMTVAASSRISGRKCE